MRYGNSPCYTACMDITRNKTLGLYRPRYLTGLTACVGLGLVAGLMFLTIFTPHQQSNGQRVYSAIAAQTALAPYRTRVLLPMLFTGLAGGNLSAYARIFTLFHFTAFPVLFLMLYQWLRRFASDTRVLIVLAGLCLYMPVSLKSWGGVGAWSVVEAICLTTMLINIKRTRLVYLITIVACLNRPASAVFLPIVYVLYQGGTHKRQGITLFGLWVLMYGTLILIQGQATHCFGVRWWQVSLERNLGTFLRDGIVANILFLPFWLLALVGYGRASARVKWLAMVLPLYLVVFVITCTWYETRVLLTMYPVIGALAVRAL